MSTLLSLAAIAALDSITRNAMAVQLYLLSTPKPVARSIILGDFFCCLGAGLLIAFGTQVLAQIFNRLGEVIYVLQLIGGVILIILGYNLDKFASPQMTKSLKPHVPARCNDGICGSSHSTAAYLAALERMTSANLPLQQLMGVSP